MAKAPQANDATEDEAGAKSPSPLMALVVITVLAGAAGGGFGWQFMKPAPKAETEAHAKPAVEKAAPVAPALPEGFKIVPLSPIVTNLAEPKGSWIRVEAAVVVNLGANKEASTLPAKITEDIVAYLRTVPLSAVEGASGMQFMREDLNERARVRGNGAVRELLIQGFVVE